MDKVESNTDSGSKSGVQCKDSSIMYLAFILRNLINLEEFKKKFREFTFNDLV